MDRPGRANALRGAAAALLVFLAGCVTLDCTPACWRDEPPASEIAQVMALWAGGVVVQPDPMRGGIPVPGLSGRVYLFGPELGTPLRAEGSLLVYLYDDQAAEEGRPVPREVWTVDAENLRRVLKKDGLGWGYSLWLPWSTYKPAVRNVQVVVCYRPVKGKEAWSGSSSLHVGGADSGPVIAPKVHLQSRHEGNRQSVANSQNHK